MRRPPQSAHCLLWVYWVCPGTSCSEPPDFREGKIRTLTSPGPSVYFMLPSTLAAEGCPLGLALCPVPGVRPSQPPIVSRFCGASSKRGSLTRIPVCHFLVQQGAHKGTLMHILCARVCTREHSQCIHGALMGTPPAFSFVSCYAQLPGSLELSVHLQQCLCSQT